ncbi:cell envelope integrity protein CreD [Hydrogenophaga sp. A37]|uniref:cell envelope integrity protein CreD n=1 Tax=Hydrogenophaga sp. A37 TaxID=1945864 RepID=UPI0009CB1403|nr:cell envelope integrity protein CreD [Hydrogenophaga sp. A37]OOG79251.1 cell envelope integrity protein CreD [Hydrogenophaga sp. A37]
MNKHPLINKTAVIGFLIVVLFLALAVVRGLVHERTQNRDAAVTDVTHAHAGAQTLVGPVLHLPYTETFTRTVVVDAATGARREDTLTEARVAFVFPETLDTKGRLTTDLRWRGIFPVRVYTSHHDTVGRFVWPVVAPREKGGQIVLGQPRVIMGVSDLRGLMSPPVLKLAGQQLPVGSSPTTAELPLPLSATFDSAAFKPGDALDFTLGLDLAGTGSIAWAPLAGDNRVSLVSAWPHPSFGGNFLPRSRSVGASGFEASWSVPSLSTQAQQKFLASGGKVFVMDSFSVSLDDPVDVYRLTDRATKYGMMFIVLTFAAFFVLEMVKRWRIHPMQYLMIGAALVLFFLLLLSLSEQLDFLWAYLIASAGCIALLTHYLGHVLGSARAGLGMGGLLVALYGVLYGILMSEDSALMMGSLLLFGVLAAIMVATRKIDWYNVMGSEPRPTAPQGSPQTPSPEPVV